MKQRHRNIIASVLGVLFLVNFIVFDVVAGHIGGHADVRHSDLGHYYVSSHGGLTEVTYGVFLYSFCHGIVLALNFAAFGLMGVYAGLSTKKESVTGNRA